MNLTPRPGDVLAVQTGGWASFAIRLGAALRNRPNLANHIAVAHHVDEAGIPWGLEGKPGGVGWVDLRRYLASPWTTINHDQPIPDAAGKEIAYKMTVMLGTPYDWKAIAADAFAALHIPDLFTADWHGQGIPGHVVCSSFAAWLYADAGLPHPGEAGHERFVTPGDWTQFTVTRGWG